MLVDAPRSFSSPASLACRTNTNAHTDTRLQLHLYISSLFVLGERWSFYRKRLGRGLKTSPDSQLVFAAHSTKWRIDNVVGPSGVQTDTKTKKTLFFFFTRLTPSFFVPFLIDIICLRFSHSAAQKKKNSNREVV